MAMAMTLMMAVRLPSIHLMLKSWPIFSTFLVIIVYRWRSMTIFSDTWAPLHAALCCLSVPRVGQGSFSNSRRGASCLETLRLMQCDEYSIRNEHFGSGVLKEPITTPFAALAGYPDGPSSHTLPARLRPNSLCGIDVNWSDFTRFISGTWGWLIKRD